MSVRWMVVLAAAIVLALPLGGCRKMGEQVQLPVGTCVRDSDTGTDVVPCAEPHTHRVTAIVPGNGDACPAHTVMWSSPADPDEDLMTTCFKADAAGE